MKLIGMLDSPYVRRVAISLRMLGLPFEHQSLSVFSTFDAFRAINPLVKAPTLIGDDGGQLVDSNLIIDWAESVSRQPSLLPREPAERLRALRLIGVALTVCEKSVQIVYEHKRATERRDADWLARVSGQLRAACDALEQAAANASPWLLGAGFSQADLTTAVAWRFAQMEVAEVVDAKAYPALSAHSARAEQLPDFLALPPV